MTETNSSYINFNQESDHLTSKEWGSISKKETDNYSVNFIKKIFLSQKIKY